MIILPHAHIKGEASHKVGQYYALGLQDFTPAEGYYDLIWCQWVLSHLTDGTVIAVCAYHKWHHQPPVVSFVLLPR